MDYSQAFLPKLRSFFEVFLLFTGMCYEAEIWTILLPFRYTSAWYNPTKVKISFSGRKPWTSVASQAFTFLPALTAIYVGIYIRHTHCVKHKFLCSFPCSLCFPSDPSLEPFGRCLVVCSYDGRQTRAGWPNTILHHQLRARRWISWTMSRTTIPWTRSLTMTLTTLLRETSFRTSSRATLWEWRQR